MTRYYCVECGRVRDSDSSFHEVGTFPEADRADVEGSDSCECGSVEYKKEKQSMTETEPDVTEKVEQTETGFTLKIKSTRGTGTRDQDTVEVEGKAETWEKLNSQRTAMRTAVTTEMDQRRMHKPDQDQEE